MIRVLRFRPVRTLLGVGTVVFVVAQIVSVAAGAILPQPSPQNPFAEYANLRPGEPIESADNLHCEYSYNYPSQAGSFSYCMYIPHDEFIDWVSVAARDGIIQRVTFGVKLRYGDLVAIFGQPEHRWRNIAVASFEWRGIHATSMVRRWTRVSMYTPVNRVAFRLPEGAG